MSGFDISMNMLSDEEFFQIRDGEVLNQWETGKDLHDLDECIAAAGEVSAGNNYAEQLLRAKLEGVHLLQPNFGRGLTEYMIEGMTFVEADSPLCPNGLWNVFSDSYTRKNNYKMAQVGLDRTRKEGTTMLNGWPIVNYGVEEARTIRKAIRSPISLNSTDADGRLSSEIALAAGWNACNSRYFQELLAHCKHETLSEMIKLNQYESRLAAKYVEGGVPQAPHVPCNLTGYDSCGFKIFIVVSSTILASAQGIRLHYLEFGLNMNLVQDCAMIHVTKKLCKEYCERFGYFDTEYVCGTFQFLGAWPPRVEEADAMIAWNISNAFLAGCETSILKCQDEAFATPTKEGMRNAVRLARQMDTLIGRQTLPTDSQEFRDEAHILELEARALLDKCIEAGDGDLAVGMCKAASYGWIGTMITPWAWNKTDCLLMRDVKKAVRYLDTGNYPFPKEVSEYHKEKLQSRADAEGRPVDFSMVVSDLQFASRLSPGTPANDIASNYLSSKGI
jgi:methylaspartate mutase epsilon subunit